MDYKIAIPSYKRAKTLKNKTYKTLLSYGFNPKDICIFVANNEEKEAYAKQFAESNIVVGVEGMKNIRNFMTDYFGGNQTVVYIDDDISGFVEMTKGRDEKPLKDLKKAINELIQLMVEYKVSLGGFYPVPNGYFMKNRINLKLSYIIGSFYVVLSGSPKVTVTVDDKEDYERSLKFWLAEGRVLRLEKYSMVSNYYKELGGMQETRTPERIKSDALKLLEKYPRFIRIAKSRGNFEIQFKKPFA